MKPCTFCGRTHRLALVPHKAIWQGTCGFCGAMGPYGQSPQDALDKWNIRQDATGCQDGSLNQEAKR